MKKYIAMGLLLVTLAAAGCGEEQKAASGEASWGENGQQVQQEQQNNGWNWLPLWMYPLFGMNRSMAVPAAAPAAMPARTNAANGENSAASGEKGNDPAKKEQVKSADPQKQQVRQTPPTTVRKGYLPPLKAKPRMGGRRR